MQALAKHRRRQVPLHRHRGAHRQPRRPGQLRPPSAQGLPHVEAIRLTLVAVGLQVLAPGAAGVDIGQGHCVTPVVAGSGALNLTLSSARLGFRHLAVAVA